MYRRRDSRGTNVGCKWDASEYDLVLFASAGSSRLLGHEGNRTPRVCFSVHRTSRWNRQARNRFGEEYPTDVSAGRRTRASSGGKHSQPGTSCSLPLHRRRHGNGPVIMSTRSEEHTSELRHSQTSYAVFCLKKIETIPWGSR